MSTDPAPTKKISLSRLIFRQYARSALFVLFTIEVLLLLIYFVVNGFIARESEEALRDEVTQLAPRLVALSADVIEEILSSVEDKTRFFAESHVRLFSDPGAFEVEGEQPILEKDPAGKGTIYQSNLTNGSSFYVPRSSVDRMGPAQWLFATNSAALNPLYKQMVGEHVVAAYVNVDEPADMNRLYPYIDKVWEQYPQDIDMKNYNFFYLANALHNEAREVRWTDLYVDPAGQGWMFSCIAPVYVGDKLEGVVGLDVTLVRIADRIAELNLPWSAVAVLVSGPAASETPVNVSETAPKPGTIIAASKNAWDFLRVSAPEEKFDYKTHGPVVGDKRAEANIFSLPDRKLSEGLEAMFLKHDSEVSVTPVQTQGGVLLVADAMIPSTGWRFFVLVREADVFAPITALRNLSSLVGWAAVGLMVLFYVVFFVWLWNRASAMARGIAEPLAKLSTATSGLAGEGAPISLASTGIEEIDRLNENFSEMASSLANKTRELVEARVESEVRGKDAELAFTRGLYQSASANLHDAGNAVTVLESSLIDLSKVVKSTDQYPEVFKRLKHGGVAAQQILDRFEHVLVGETVPRLRSLSASIVRLKDTIKRSIHEQQAAFRAMRRQGEFKREFSQASEAIDLSAMLEEICAIFRKSYPALETDIAQGLMVRSHRTPLWSGIDNLIRNAIDASTECSNGRIRVCGRPAENGAVVLVADEGEGITEERLQHVGERGYTTKSFGNGLGLSSFREFLEFFGGSLVVRSEGLGKGAEFTATIKNA